jgi:hypothetical protein
LCLLRFPVRNAAAQDKRQATVFLLDEVKADQHLTQHGIGTVDVQFDGSKTGFSGVSKAAFDDMGNPVGDMGNPVGSCVGHHEPVEGESLALLRCDHCSSAVKLSR